MSLTDLSKPETSPPAVRATVGKPWQPGQSGNPNGRPRQARDRLTQDVINGLAADFGRNGQKAIAKLREQDVASYLRVCVALIPKEVHLAAGPLDELSDEELSALVNAAKKAVARATGS